MWTLILTLDDDSQETYGPLDDVELAEYKVAAYERMEEFGDVQSITVERATLS